MSIIKTFIKESEDIPYELYERRDELMDEALIELRDAEDDNISQFWVTLPFREVKKVWEEYMSDRGITSRRLMEEIKDLVIDNILKIDINNELSGHSTSYPLDELVNLDIAEDYEEAEEIITEKWDKRIYNYIYDERAGQMRISDYAMDKLMKIAWGLSSTDDPDKWLLLVDKAFHVVHQRSDISAWFIEGGHRSLDKLAGKQ